MTITAADGMNQYGLRAPDLDLGYSRVSRVQKETQWIIYRERLTVLRESLGSQAKHTIRREKERSTRRGK